MKIIAILTVVIAFVALIFAYGLASWNGRKKEGNESVTKLSGFIKEGTRAYWKQVSFVMLPVVVVITLLMGFIMNWTTAAFYFTGALFSSLAVFFGVKSAAAGTARVVDAAVSEGMNPALKVLFRSGAVMGLCTAGLGLLGLGGAVVILGVKMTSVTTGFGFGAVTAALFSRVGGGIFLKAAEAGNQLIVQAETGIAKDDPRNPGSVAACAGELNGNAAGLASEMFLSYAGAIIAAFLITAATREIKPNFGYPFDLPLLQGTIFPLAVFGAGLIAAIAGVMFVRGNLKSNPVSAINAGKYLSNTITVLFSGILSYAFFGNLNCAAAILIGMLTGALCGRITNTYTSGNTRSLKKIAEKSTAGSLMMNEFGIGMKSTVWPVIILAAGILAANGFADYYGIALTAVGILSTTGMITAIDAFGPAAKNVGVVVRMIKVSEEAGNVPDLLNKTGEGNSATGKGFATGAAALTAVSLMIAYMTFTEMTAVNLMKPAVIAALLLGAMLPVLFTALTMNSSIKSTISLVENIKNQFTSDAGIMAGTVKPAYGKCVEAGTKSALKGLFVPGILAVLVPFAVGISMGTEALGGLLAGTLVSGILGSLIFSNNGGNWNHGEKFAAEDPFKDAAGYSINCFLILLTLTTVTFAPVLLTIRSML